jgi:tetratricopeptide (TPR) repeat protein
MHPCIRFLLAITLVLARPAAAPAQDALATSASDEIARGIAAERSLNPAAALRHYETAVARDSANYEANWRAAMALIDLGQETPDSVRSTKLDSLYATAETYARRAMTVDSTKANGHFVLALAIGRAALTKGKKERVRRAIEIRSEALKAAAIDSTHDGAFHVIGRWNAEVMRLSSFSRFMAKTFLGGKILGEASWQVAIDNLERAARLDPTRIYHHLDLAQVYIDRKRYADARRELQMVDSLPSLYFMDTFYKSKATTLRQKIAGR